MTEKRIIRGAFDRDACHAHIEGATMTKQAFADECNINNIIDRYTRSGIMPMMPDRPPVFLDCSSGLSYHESLNFVMTAEKQFMKLPATLREIFSNDAGTFLEFYSNPANDAKCQELGLKPRVPISTVKTEVKPDVETDLKPKDSVAK